MIERTARRDALDWLTGSDVVLVDLERVRAAAERLRGVSVRTPLLRWDEQLQLKPENLQPTGSFKIRGAYTRLSRLSPEERERGIVAYSSGNHAQAVARAAKILGVHAVIVMPSNAPEIKVAHVAEDGAEIVRCGPASDERRSVAEDLAMTTGRVLVPPYDDLDVIAGQGTIGLEVVEQEPELAAVLVPIGGGGLASGVSTVVKALRPGAQVIGVEPEFAADARESLRRGQIVRWSAEETSRTVADGLRTQSLGHLTFEHLRRSLDEIVTVSEAAIARTTIELADRNHIVVEPSGAVALAAYVTGVARGYGRMVAIVSGGNISVASLSSLWESVNGR